MGNLFHLPHTYNTQGKKKKEEGEEGNSLKKREDRHSKFLIEEALELYFAVPRGVQLI